MVAYARLRAIHPSHACAYVEVGPKICAYASLRPGLPILRRPYVRCKSKNTVLMLAKGLFRPSASESLRLLTPIMRMQLVS
eukprot:6221598-Karenia_brevis.AAC.1